MTVLTTLGATETVTAEGCILYYPDYGRVDLVVEHMPSSADSTITFCCEAAFTGELLDTFSHMNIADDHVSGGVAYKGYRCSANTGAFIFRSDGTHAFMLKKDFGEAQKAGAAMAFCQRLLVLDGETCPMWSLLRNNRTVYRTLCEDSEGRLCLVQGGSVMTLEQYVKCLERLKVRNAIYLDMGAGWNYAFYRDPNSTLCEIFPESKTSKYFKYRTNWIVFYKS